MKLELPNLKSITNFSSRAMCERWSSGIFQNFFFFSVIYEISILIFSVLSRYFACFFIGPFFALVVLSPGTHGFRRIYLYISFFFMCGWVVKGELLRNSRRLVSNQACFYSFENYFGIYLLGVGLVLKNKW